MNESSLSYRVVLSSSTSLRKACSIRILITYCCIVEACIRVDPVMAMGPVHNDTLVTPLFVNTGCIRSKTLSTSSGLLNM